MGISHQTPTGEHSQPLFTLRGALLASLQHIRVPGITTLALWSHLRKRKATLLGMVAVPVTLVLWKWRQESLPTVEFKVSLSHMRLYRKTIRN